MTMTNAGSARPGWRGMLVVAALLLSGCAYSVGYNSTYLPAPAAGASGERVAGEVLIYMPQQDVDWVYSGHPTSFTASATTLSIPLGSITQQIAVRVFARDFSSVQAVTSLEGRSGYLVEVQPKVRHFEYAYNQLRNLGFAITPEVSLELHVLARDPAGKVVLDKVYESGLVQGETYMASASPAEKTNTAVHQVLWRLLSQAATDIRAAHAGP